MTQLLPAGQQTLRRHNAALVLDTIARVPGASRAAIATHTGLTKATVSALVERLIEAGLVAAGRTQTRSGPGRPATSLHLSPDGPRGLGLEIGVDHLAVCVVDLLGTVRAERRTARDNRAGSPADAVAALTGLAADLTAGVAGVGLAVPGLVQAGTGLLRFAPNLGWRDVDLAGLLRERLGADLPVLVANEANLAALAQLHDSRSQDARTDFLYLSCDVGIGAGLVVDGRLFGGVSGPSGEIGHLTVDPDGPTCSCGAQGCLESLAGLEYLLRAAGAADLDTLLALLDRDDDRATAALRSAARALGIAVAGTVNLTQLHTVVLGGSYPPLAGWLLPGMRAELDRRVVGADRVELDVAALGTAAAVRGAARHGVGAVIADPEPYVARLLG